jgi:uncharacterized protein (DUF1778 family)
MEATNSPSTARYEQIAVRLTPEEKTRIEQEAASEHRSTAKFIRAIVLSELERRDDDRKAA